jgi:hypothetical protein
MNEERIGKSLRQVVEQWPTKFKITNIYIIIETENLKDQIKIQQIILGWDLTVYEFELQLQLQHWWNNEMQVSNKQKNQHQWSIHSE